MAVGNYIGAAVGTYKFSLPTAVVVLSSSATIDYTPYTQHNSDVTYSSLNTLDTDSSKTAVVKTKYENKSSSILNVYRQRYVSTSYDSQSSSEYSYFRILNNRMNATTRLSFSGVTEKVSFSNIRQKPFSSIKSTISIVRNRV